MTQRSNQPTGLNFWTGKKIVVTGWMGFVGANLVKALLDRGADVMTGYDCGVNRHGLNALGFDGEFPTRDVDVADPSEVDDAINRDQPDYVFHLAGLGHISDCQRCPGPAFRINTLGTVNVLEAVRYRAPHAVVVCASSNHAYIGGNPKAKTTTVTQRPGGGYGLTEASPLMATDAYGASKAAADAAVRCYRDSYGLRAAALRHVNCYGPCDPHESHLVTGSILACLKGERPKLKSDGTAVKAYLHVAEIVSAYLTVAENIEKLPGHAVNVTDPDAETSALSIARTIMDIAGLEGGPQILRVDLSQSGYEERLDATLLRSLGWAPQYSLYRGLQHAYAWYKEHGGMKWRDG